MPENNSQYDVIVIGAELVGLYQLYKLRQLKLKVLVIEAGDNVGGMVLEPLSWRQI